MRIFHKLLILLLVIGLLPLLSLSLHDQRLTEDLGIELAAQARDSATRRMSDELHRIVALSASVLHRTRLLVDLALRVQGREAELRLAAPAQAPEERMPVWFAEQYDAGMAPPDTEASKAHLRYLPGAPDAAALAVSFDHQVFLTAPGVDREAVRDDIARLVPMTSIYRSLRETLPGLFLFQYTALASGLHSSYPGHGGYPQGYDPRRRAWYSLATAVGEPIWTPPLIDASTRQLLFTAAAPVREPSGAIAGVTAVDVPILSLLQRIRDEAQLPGNVESLLVQVQRNDRRGPALRVIAHREYQASGRPWDALLEPAWLLPEAGESHAAMLRALGEGGSGTVRQPYRGTDSLWAYAGAPGLNVALLMIVPFEEIARETDIAERRARELTRRQLAIAGGALATVMLIVVALAFAGARSVTRPVRTLLQAARDVAAGDFDRRVDIRSRDEFGELGAAFNEMVPQLKERMEIRQSLEVAQEVQQHLLPTEAPVAPGLDVAGRIDYADETGGDYYDFLTPPDVPEGEVGIAVGDATGHGVAAALLMAGLRAGLRNAMVRQDSLDLLAARLNRQFARDAKGGRFMTLTYMQIDGVAREARWISAGHDPILFYDPVADAFEELDAPDIPLGIDPERAFRACRRGGWPDGGLLVFGTDGVWEARNPHGEMFGKERLKDAVRARRDAGAAEICAAIGEVLERFRAGRPAADDVTLVVVRFLPPS